MTPAPIGLTFANYVAFPNLASMSVAHHAVRLAVLLVVFVGALGLSQPSAAAPVATVQVQGAQ